MDEPYVVGFVTEESPAVTQVYEQCLDSGLTFTPGGDTDRCAEYRVGSELHRDAPTEAAVDQIVAAGRGSLYVFTDSGMRIRLGIADATSEEEKLWGQFTMNFQTVEIDWDHHDETVVRDRIKELIDLVIDFTPVVDPTYVWSAVYGEYGRDELRRPDGRPIIDHIDNISWITVMSEDVIEQFGGREHVLTTPVWRSQELDSGHIVIVTNDHPYDPREGGTWRDHLFGD